MKYEKSCGAIVFDDDKVLVVKHRAGHVDFPKGHMENQETEEETAIREVKEETNIDIYLEGCRNTVHYSPKEGVEKDVVFFAAKKVKGDISPQLEEVSEVKWISINDVKKVLTYESSIDVFEKILEERKIKR